MKNDSLTYISKAYTKIMKKKSNILLRFYEVAERSFVCIRDTFHISL